MCERGVALAEANRSAVPAAAGELVGQQPGDRTVDAGVAEPEVPHRGHVHGHDAYVGYSGGPTRRRAGAEVAGGTPQQRDPAPGPWVVGGQAAVTEQTQGVGGRCPLRAARTTPASMHDVARKWQPTTGRRTVAQPIASVPIKRTARLESHRSGRAGRRFARSLATDACHVAVRRAPYRARSLGRLQESAREHRNRLR
jgi:hypothetical protein